MSNYLHVCLASWTHGSVLELQDEIIAWMCAIFGMHEYSVAFSHTVLEGHHELGSEATNVNWSYPAC